MNQTGMVRYFVEIESTIGGYVASIHQGNSATAFSVPDLKLGQTATVAIKGQSYTLGDLVRALIEFHSADLQAAFDERGQLGIGSYLYAQTLGQLPLDERERLHRPDREVEIRIITQDEHIARLPWVLLANNGISLSTTDWSIAISGKSVGN